METDLCDTTLCSEYKNTTLRWSLIDFWEKALIFQSTKIIFEWHIIYLFLFQLLELCPIDLLIGGSPCNEISLVNHKRQGLTGKNWLIFIMIFLLMILKDVHGLKGMFCRASYCKMRGVSVRFCMKHLTFCFHDYQNVMLCHRFWNQPFFALSILDNGHVMPALCC